MALPIGRSPQILLGIALVILGGIAAASTVQLSRLKSQLVEKQQTVVSLTAQNDDLTQQLAALATQRKELEGRLTELRNQVSSATGEMGRLRGSVEELQTRYKALEEDNAVVQAQVNRITKERDEARDTIRRVEEEKKDLERAAVRLRERLTFLDRDYQQLAAKVSNLERQNMGQPAWADSAAPMAAPGLARPSSPGSGALSEEPQALGAGQTVELPPIIVRKDQGGTGLPVRGQVVEVNDSHRFVVVDQGANDGVQVGMIFDILRAGARVAQAVAVRVRPQLTACDLVTSRSPEFPRVGDMAIQRNP